MSSSSSSSAWSESEADSDSEATQASLPQQAQAPRPSHGEKLPFEPPQGYEFATHSQDVLSSFSYSALESAEGNELWCIKIPDGVCVFFPFQTLF